MDPNEFYAQIILAFLKEGLSFLFSNIKDRQVAQNAEDDSAKQAETAAIDAVKTETPTPKTTIRWDKVATLFWLGNDLMWIQDVINRAATPDRVIQGVDAAIQYSEELGFSPDSLPMQELDLAKQTLQQLLGFVPSTTQKLSVLEGHYRGIQQRIQTVKWYVHALASNQQPEFKKIRAL